MWQRLLYLPTVIFIGAALLVWYRLGNVEPFLNNFCVLYAGKLLFSGCIFCVVNSYFEKSGVDFRVVVDHEAEADYRLEADDLPEAVDRSEEDNRMGVDHQWKQLMEGYGNPSEEQNRLNITIATIAGLQVVGVIVGTSAPISVSAVLVLTAAKDLAGGSASGDQKMNKLVIRQQ